MVSMLTIVKTPGFGGQRHRPVLNSYTSQTIAHRVGRFLERQGLLERDAENVYLAGNVLE